MSIQDETDRVLHSRGVVACRCCDAYYVKALLPCCYRCGSTAYVRLLPEETPASKTTQPLSNDPGIR